MKNIKINNLIEYLSINLIILYIIVHNIFLVLNGITFTLYLININMINNLKSSINKDFIIKKEYKYSNKNDKKIKLNTINIKSIKVDSNLRLV